MASTDAMPVPRKNVAFRAYFAIFDADGDPVTSAGSLDSEISKDGGTFTDCSNEATEIATASGCYYLDLTSTEMNADAVVIQVKSASGKTSVLIFYPEEAGDIRADAVMISGDSTAADNLESAFDGTGYTDGTAQAGASTSITLAAGASSTTDFYVGALVAIVGGTGGGQAARLITAYNGTTKVATVTPAWATNPASGSTYVIIPWGSVPAVTGSIGSLATQAKADVNAEVLDVLNADTFAELAAIPGATTTLTNMMRLIYEFCRNKLAQTGPGSSGTQTLYKDDGTTPLGTSSVTDDGTTFTRGKFS